MLQVIRTGCVLLIIHISIVTGQGDVEVIFSSTTETGTDFYKDEPLILSCKTDKTPNLTGAAFIYGIAFADGVEDPDITGCTINSARGTAAIGNPADVTIINGIDSEECDAVKADLLLNMQLTVLIEPALESYTMSCNSRSFITDALTASQKTLKLDTADIKEAPTGLVMTVPERVVEGEGFSVTCAPGVQGVPQSQYEYDIIRGDMPIVDNHLQWTYTPTEDDRVGFSVRCTDTAHPNWRNKSDTIATSQTLYAEFIDVGDDAGTDRTITLNPGFITNTLTCDIIAHNGANIGYTWTSSVDSEKRAKTRVLTLDSRENIQAGDTEPITCEGTVGELKQTITWTITWNMQATTTQTPTTQPRKDNKAGLYGGVGAAVAVAVGICIVMALVVRHKRTKGTNGGVDAATTLHFRTHDSASHEYDLPPVLSEVSIDNSSNIASTSTKTYEQLQMPVSDAVYSQPDEHLYSALMKSTQRTQPTNQRETTEASSEYVNCANLTHSS